MRMRLLAVSAALAFTGPLRAQTPVEFKIDDAWGRDSVQFTTTAPLEDITGTTNQVTGFVRADFRSVKGPATAARIEVDVTALKTGIEMRDGGVRKALGAEAHPRAIFTLERVKSSSAEALAPNSPVEVVAVGSFELNGVRKPLEVPATITYVPKGGPFSRMRPGNFVRITSSFEIKLSDYNVERNGPVLPLQVGETARVKVSLLASDASAEEAEEYRQKAIKYMGKSRG